MVQRNKRNGKYTSEMKMRLWTGGNYERIKGI